MERIDNETLETKYINEPIYLHKDPDLVITNEDIEEVVPSEHLPKDTLALQQKEGFPTYHINPDTRLLIVISDGLKSFRLKPDSKLLSDFKVYAENRFGSRS